MGVIKQKIMITLKVFNTSLEAHILKSKLESEGIESYLFDENTMDMNPLYNYTIGGVKLKIEQKYLAQAQAILTAIGEQPYTNNQDQIIHCPQCNSTDLGNGIKKPATPIEYFSLLLVPFLAIFPFVKSTSFYCKNCQKVFRQ